MPLHDAARWNYTRPVRNKRREEKHCRLWFPTDEYYSLRLGETFETDRQYEGNSLRCVQCCSIKYFSCLSCRTNVSLYTTSDVGVQLVRFARF